MIAKGGPLT